MVVRINNDTDNKSSNGYYCDPKMPAICRAERKLSKKPILTTGFMDHAIARNRKNRYKKCHKIMGRDI